MARGEAGLQVLRIHVVEHRLAGIPGCVGGNGGRHTSPHGQKGENGNARSCPPIYCSNVQYTSKKLTGKTEETCGTHRLAVRRWQKVRLEFLYTAKHPEHAHGARHPI